MELKLILRNLLLAVNASFLLANCANRISGFASPGLQTELSASRQDSMYAIRQPLEDGATLRVLTFNLWGIPLITPHRSERIKAVGQKLAAIEPDIVCLQEVWMEKDREKLIECLQTTRLRHFVYFPNRPFGSGLFILSAYPILETRFQPYTQSGKWYKPWHGDWYAGKGIALASIQLPGGIVDVVNTHIISKYDENDEYLSTRQTQLKELDEFLESFTRKESPVLLFGDFNCQKGDPEFEAAVDRSHLQRLMNTGVSIDNIFAVENGQYQFSTLNTVRIKDSFLIDGQDIQLSDHAGYLSTIEIRPGKQIQYPQSVPVIVNSTSEVISWQ